MTEKAKEILSDAFVILESINWGGQTLTARKKWGEARILLQKTNNLLDENEGE